MDFWIDQYGVDLDNALDVAIKISRAEIDKKVTEQFRQLSADPNTTAGLIKSFCELVMIFDLISLEQHDGKGLARKIGVIFERLRHSNFTENDANILAGVITHLCVSNENIWNETKEYRYEYANTDTQFNLKYVHPKIMMIARNLHPEINKIYESFFEGGQPDKN